MPYVPTQCPANVDSDGLRHWVQEEFFRLAQATAVVDNVVLKVTYVAPVYVVEGMVVYADGTTWNPGGGRGLYQRVSGAWVKL